MKDWNHNPLTWPMDMFDATAAFMITALMPGVFWGMLGARPDQAKARDLVK